MSAYYQRQDLRHYVCTDPETAYGVVTAQARIEGAAGREFMLARDVIAEAIKRTGYNLCGGEFNSIFTDAQNAAELLVEEYNARGLSGQVVAGDIDDQNYDVTPQQVSDLIGSIAAIQTLMGQGHATNFARCIKR